MFFGSKGSLRKITPMMSSGWSQPVLQILNTKLALRATCGKFKIALFSLDKKISNTQQVPAFVFHVNGYNWHLLPCQIALQRSQLFIGHSSNWLWGKHPRGHANFLMRVEVKEVGLRLFFYPSLSRQCLNIVQMAGFEKDWGKNMFK